jgi:hypothetical protein
MTSADRAHRRPFTLPTALHSIVHTVWPHGGQRQARSNAWQAVCTDRIRAWEREEARRALELVGAEPDRPKPGR